MPNPDIFQVGVGTAGGGGGTPPPAGQPGSSDWSVTVSAYANDAGGVRKGFIEFTVINLAAGATRYHGYIYRGNPKSTDPNDYAFCATAYTGIAGFTFGEWEECAIGALTYWVVLVADTDSNNGPVDATAIANAKSVTLAAQGAPLAPTVFSATTTPDDGAGRGVSGSISPPPKSPGVPSVKLDFVCTFLSDTNRNYAEIQRRYASNGAFDGTTVYSDWGPMIGNISANNQSAHSDHPTTGWLDVSLAEWGQLRLRVFDLTGSLYTDCATVLNYTWTGGLLQLSQADPDSLGKGITISGGQIKTTTSDSNNLLLNPGFDYALKDWNTSGPITPLSGVSWAMTGGTMIQCSPGSFDIEQLFDVRPGDSFYLDAWVHCDATPPMTGVVVCGIIIYDSSSTPIVTAASPGLAPGGAAAAGWVKISATITAPASSAASIGKFYVQGNNASGSWFIDNVYCSRQPQAAALGVSQVVDQGILLAADAGNGGFNLKFDDSATALLGWTVPSTSRWSVDGSNGIGGGNCMKITSTSSVAEGAFNLFAIKAANGQKFTARAWSKASGFTGTVKLRLVSYDASGSVLGTNDGSALSATGSMVETSDIITLSAGSTTAYIVLEVLANTSAGSFYVDNISVSRTGDADDTADGVIGSVKFEAGALADLTKYSSTVRPLTVVAALPTLPDTNYPNGAIVFLTSDGGLYKNKSGTWDKKTNPATEMAAGTLFASVVYAGSINVAQLNAGTLTSNDMVITANGIKVQVQSIYDSIWGDYVGLIVRNDYHGGTPDTTTRAVLGIHGLGMYDSANHLVSWYGQPPGFSSYGFGFDFTFSGGLGSRALCSAGLEFGIYGATYSSFIGAARFLDTGGNQLLKESITGWGTPTGTLLRAALTNSSTTTDVLQTLMALITDIKTHGFLRT